MKVIWYFILFLMLILLVIFLLFGKESDIYIYRTIPYKVYCISHNNQERKSRMTRRFEKLSIPYHFSQTCDECMLSHRKALQEFIEDNTTEFGIICEDDVYIKLSFVRDIQKFLSFMERRPSLDLLLIGYLLHPSIDIATHPDFTVEYPIGSKTCYPYTLYSYPTNLWGAQMYIVSKTSARSILRRTTKERCALLDVPFSADFTITKIPYCVLAYPPIAVEEGYIQNPNPSQEQITFHKECSKRYDPTSFL